MAVLSEDCRLSTLLPSQGVAWLDVHRDGSQHLQGLLGVLVQLAVLGKHLVHRLLVPVVLPCADVPHLGKGHIELELVVGSYQVADACLELRKVNLVLAVSENLHRALLKVSVELESGALPVGLAHTKPDAAEQPGYVGEECLERAVMC